MVPSVILTIFIRIIYLDQRLGYGALILIRRINQNFVIIVSHCTEEKFAFFIYCPFKFLTANI